MVANNPKNVAARLQIAILYARYGLYEDAELAFEALGELAPDNAAVMTNQGNLNFLQQDFAAAISAYSRAAALDSEDGGIWINLSMAQFKSGDLQQARNSYQNAVQLDASLKDEYSAYSKLLSN
jgi:Flp pilus assembly protein TadD